MKVDGIGKFLAGPVGSAIRVFCGTVLGLLVTWLSNGNTFDDLTWYEVKTWAGVGITVAVPIIIAWLNPSDTRFGRTSVGDP